jgi:anti-sigma factor ChrR (cupin superfamily)
VQADAQINADFSRRVVIATDRMFWMPSPEMGVERRMLDRIGGEVARATSLVRYAPDSKFPAHDHDLGEEFLVLAGVFSDEHGDYPAGTYVRNPPGSRHAPNTAPGCTILVKLRQMPVTERRRVVINTQRACWQRGGSDAHRRLVLYLAANGTEFVTLERLAAGAALPADDCPGGEELFILSGSLADRESAYGAGTWMRCPAGYRRAALTADGGATIWVKRGHLPAA